MIRLFGITDTDFTTNGDVVLKPIYAHVHRADNGNFYLDLEVGLEYADVLTAGKIVVAPTKDGDQAFRVYKPVKSGSVISAICRHVFYDTENRVIVDTNVVNKTCNEALVQLNNAAVPSSPFSVISDIVTTKNYRCVRKSLYEAIQVVLERWGGHLVRNNFAIEVRANIGSDKGVNISYGKNLEQIRSTEDWSDVVTQLLPVGKDGTLLNAVDPSASIYVTSTTQYDIPYTKTVSFSQDINPDDYPTEDAYKAALVADLQAQAQAYVNEHCIPYVNYELEAVNVDATIGDTIKVDDERLGIELLTNVIEYEYDCITEQIVGLQFGNFRKNLTDLLTTVRNTASGVADQKVAESQTVLEKELQDATDAIMSLLDDGHVVINGSNIMVLDNLPAEDAQDVLIIDRGGIGFSRTGIHGTFTTAWQIDGTFLANVIKAGILGDSSGKNYWNLDTGQFVTKQGTIGNFVIDSTGLNYDNGKSIIDPSGIVYSDGATWRVTISDKMVFERYVNGAWVETARYGQGQQLDGEYASILAGGSLVARFSNDVQAGVQGCKNWIIGDTYVTGKLIANSNGPTRLWSGDLESYGTVSVPYGDYSFYVVEGRPSNGSWTTMIVHKGMLGNSPVNFQIADNIGYCGFTAYCVGSTAYFDYASKLNNGNITSIYGLI